MTWQEALEIVIARTGVQRYRFLCSEEYREHLAYRRFMVDMAGETVIPLDESLALHRLVHACPYRSTQGCGCSGARCGLSGRLVAPRECLECVRKFGA